MSQFHPGQIEEAMRELMAARDAILSVDPDFASDERLLHDTLDASGNAMDLLRALVRASIEASARADAARLRARDVEARAQRYAARSDRLRAGVTAALSALGLSKLEDAEFTASLRVSPPAVVVTDPDMLPDEFVRVSRTPDKAALKVALKEGRTIPGASLNNPPLSLSVRAT